MRPIDSGNPLDATGAAIAPDLTPLGTGAPAPAAPSQEQPMDTADPAPAAGKRQEQNLEASYFKGLLGQAQPTPGSGVLYDRAPSDAGAAATEAKQNNIPNDAAAAATGTKQSGAAPQNAGPTVSADVKTLLEKGANYTSTKTGKGKDGKDDPDVLQTRQDFDAAKTAIGKGDYTTASKQLDKLLRKQGEFVLSDDDVDSTRTVLNQLNFLSAMQTAKIKADYPPTETQLEDYFKTLKNNPDAARNAFEAYAQNFHVHPADVKSGGSSVQYSNDQYNVPQNWSDVASRPVSVTDNPKHIGKQKNDCEGFALIANKLLGAAGFKVNKYIEAFPIPSSGGGANVGHEMVQFTRPGEKGFTLTSNNKVFTGTDQKGLSTEGLKSAAGAVSGKEHYYGGKTSLEAKKNMVNKDNELK